MMMETQKLVSIPSRRVGDLICEECSVGRKDEFPSPQGGSETLARALGINLGGDVSIPSRRVGDLSLRFWSGHRP